MAISKAIEQSKSRYGLSYLYTENDNNDVTYFINYNLGCMERALENTNKYIEEKQHEQREAMKFVQTHPRTTASVRLRCLRTLSNTRMSPFQ